MAALTATGTFATSGRPVSAAADIPARAPLTSASPDDRPVTVAVADGESISYIERPASEAGRLAAAVHADGADGAGAVLAVAEETPVSMSAWPTADPLATLQWAIPILGLDRLDPRASGAGIRVAVLDTGVRGDHPDLAGRVVDGGDFTGDGLSGLVDPAGHGTHVAGIIAANRNNGVGVAGGTPSAIVTSYRVLTADGSGRASSVAQAITAATDDGADIINLSLGGPDNAVLDAAVENAVSRGVLVVAAAGNNGSTTNAVEWPAALPGVLAVGSVTQQLLRSLFSTTGDYVDVAAPGSGILSTWASGSMYAYASGTSMATPYVAAVAAAIWSAHPNATAAQVRAAIESTAVDLGSPGVDASFGHGLVDTVAALATLDSIPPVEAGNPTIPLDPPVNPAPMPMTPAGSFSPVEPARVFDTRAGGGGLRSVVHSPVEPGRPLEIAMTDLAGLVPADGLAAVSLNVTVTNSISPGFVTVYPCGAQPEVSSVNYAAGQTVANAVIAPVSATGTVCFASLTTTDVIVDINGWFGLDRGFTAVAPVRAFDTRPGGGGVRDVSRTPVGGGSRLAVGLTDLAGVVPPAGVSAVSLNVTAVDPSADGFVTVQPCAGASDVSSLDVSSLNYVAGATVANAVIAPVSADGTVCFDSLVPTDLVVDVNGWFAAGSSFTPVAPARLFDTRSGRTAGASTVPPSPIGGDLILAVRVADFAGGALPTTGVGAVAINVTAVDARGDGFVTVFPCGPRAPVSSVNYRTGQIVANAVIAPVSAEGTVCLASLAPTDLVVDITGWFRADTGDDG